MLLAVAVALPATNSLSGMYMRRSGPMSVSNRYQIPATLPGLRVEFMFPSLYRFSGVGRRHQNRNITSSNMPNTCLTMYSGCPTTGGIEERRSNWLPEWFQRFLTTAVSPLLDQVHDSPPSDSASGRLTM